MEVTRSSHHLGLSGTETGTPGRNNDREGALSVEVGKTRSLGVPSPT